MGSKVVENEEGRIVGTMDGDVFTPLAPAPIGDQLIDLIDECCEWFEAYVGKAKEKLVPELHADRKGHSRFLMEGLHECGASVGHGGIRSWIVNGTLRDRQQMAGAVNDYLDRRERRARMTRSSHEWKFDHLAMIDIGAKFSANPPRVLLTQEMLAEEAAKRSEAIRQSNAVVAKERREIAEVEVEMDKKLRVKRLLKTLSNDFFTMDDLDFQEAENVPPAWHDVMKRRGIFKIVYEGVVTRSINAGKSDKEIMKHIEMLNQAVQGSFKSSVPDPLQPGETRQYFTTNDIDGAMRVYENLADDQAADLQLAMDNRWCITIRTITPEERAQ